ncbi:hypothetical protein TSAR_000266 [Trichomalopsis sarcophagae]|uniref:Uncharacterized protein n=1 Tax=Trichomalopsis sarcophagae TaxID=543379 RepID=A0A232EJN8_9HYME|nr:hypothetical protein TSAR_000266 [Trichomalopsis sarcophagae]
MNSSLTDEMIVQKFQEMSCFPRTRHPRDQLLYTLTVNNAHKQVEEAKLNYHHSRLSNITDVGEIWRELEKLEITISKETTPSRFSTDDLNRYFSGISNDPLAPSVDEQLQSLDSLEYPVHFSFSEITESDVLATVQHFTSQARGIDGIPQFVVSKVMSALEWLVHRQLSRYLETRLFLDDLQTGIKRMNSWSSDQPSVQKLLEVY